MAPEPEWNASPAGREGAMVMESIWLPVCGVTVTSASPLRTEMVVVLYTRMGALYLQVSTTSPHDTAPLP